MTQSILSLFVGTLHSQPRLDENYEQQIFRQINVEGIFAVMCSIKISKNDLFLIKRLNAISTAFAFACTSQINDESPEFKTHGKYGRPMNV